MDIVDWANRWLDKEIAELIPEIVEASFIIETAVEEIHSLRRVLTKIARLGSNAATDSYLDECGKLAFNAITKREQTNA